MQGHSPMAILQKHRQHRGHSISQPHSGATPSSLSSSFIDHAFDHPTPTSFSQLQFLSSSAASDGGSDFIQRVPKVEEKFCSNFHCCGQELDDLHHLLEHFEECHVLAGPPDQNGQHPLSATASTFDSNNSDDADTPEFDDFDDEEQMKPASSQPGVVGNSTNPTLSAPPSPAMSSHSDAHPTGFGAASGTSSSAAVHPLYELKKRTTNNGSQSSFPMLSRKGKSRSPPSENEEAVSMTDEDDGVGHLPFARRSRQQSVDSIASISSNASTASKKRSFGAAMGAPGAYTQNPGTPSSSKTSNQNSNRASMLGIDFAQLRGRGLTSGLSTPDSSVPGTPASEIDEMEMISNSGCLPPSLLYPRARQPSVSENEMHTDEEDESEYEHDQSNNSNGFEEEYHFGDLGENIPVPDMDLGEFSSSVPRGPDMKKPKKGSASGSFASSSGTKNQRNNNYDSSTDNVAAAMFSPLSLLSQGGNPTAAPSGNEATASAATLAAIQAAAEAGQFPATTTPSGRVWVPNNAKPFKCTVPGCDKAYKQQNGLKYHRLHGHCNSNATGQEGEEKEEDKPFGCYVGPACGKKYKNMNGLRYHYQHSGAHGQIGLQMLTNGTHPPPAYPPGHKRSTSRATEFNNGQVIMNQSTAEALLASITTESAANPNGPNALISNSRPGSRPGTPAHTSRNASPDDAMRRNNMAGGNAHHNKNRSPSRQTSLSQQQIDQMTQRLQQGQQNNAPSTYSSMPIPVSGL